MDGGKFRGVIWTKLTEGFSLWSQEYSIFCSKSSSWFFDSPRPSLSLPEQQFPFLTICFINVKYSHSGRVLTLLMETIEWSAHILVIVKMWRYWSSSSRSSSSRLTSSLEAKVWKVLFLMSVMTNLNANYEDEERIMLETETEFKLTSISYKKTANLKLIFSLNTFFSSLCIKYM